MLQHHEEQMTPLLVEKQVNSLLKWKLLASVSLLLLIGVSIALIVVATNGTPSALEDHIDNIVSDPKFGGALWGVHIEKADGTVLYSHNAHNEFIVASNTKLLTTSAAFLSLNMSASLETTVDVVGDPPFASEVYVRGQGDPTITAADMKRVATELSDLGYTSIGNITVNNFAFASSQFPGTWEWDDFKYYYGVPVSGLIAGANVIDFSVVPAAAAGLPAEIVFAVPQQQSYINIRNKVQTVSEEGPFQAVSFDYVPSSDVITVTGAVKAAGPAVKLSAASLQPSANFVEMFARVLEEAGITVSTTAVQEDYRAEPVPATAVTRANFSSAPLGDLLHHCLQVSDNLYAELALRWVGGVNDATITDDPQFDAASAGLAAVKDVLTGVGVSASGYTQADGSGLSRQNRISPMSLIETLREMKSHSEYRSYLPVCGVSGTLASRFKDTPVQGNCQAKTGTVTGCSALSGFLVSPTTSHTVLFSIVAMGAQSTTAVTRTGIDEIVTKVWDSAIVA